jgi:mRNA interferase MazF
LPTRVERGELYWLDWSPGRGSEQSGKRPALIVQSNVPNAIERYGMTIVVAVTSAIKGHRSSVQVSPTQLNGLTATSEVLCNQIQTVGKERLRDYIGRLTDAEMREVNARLRYMLAL